MSDADLPAGWHVGEWWSPSLATRPPRLRLWAHDGRWRTNFATAWRNGHLVGVVPMGNSRVPQTDDPAYDAAKITGSGPADARAWVLIGGGRDLSGGAAVHATVPLEDRHQIIRSLVKTAVLATMSQDLHPVALYVPNDLLKDFRGGFIEPRHLELGKTAAVSGVFPDLNAYLGTVSKTRRNKIRRDWRDAADLGLVARWVPAEVALDAGAPLVAQVKRAHGIADDPRFARLRLQQWMSAGAGDHQAVEVVDQTGQVVATSFTFRSGSAMEVHEVGLTPDPAVRLHAYLLACYYAPIRAYIQLGLSRLELGTGALDVKRRRGAALSSVWAVSEARPADNRLANDQ